MFEWKSCFTYTGWACLGAVSLTIIHLRSCLKLPVVCNGSHSDGPAVGLDDFHCNGQLPQKRVSSTIVTIVSSECPSFRETLLAITCERVQNPISARRVKTKPYGNMVFMLSYVAWAKRELEVQVGLLMGIRYKHAISIPISWDVTPLTTTSIMSFDNFSEWLDATPRPENIWMVPAVD